MTKAAALKIINSLRSEAAMMRVQGERQIATATRIESEANSLLESLGNNSGGARKGKVELSEEQKHEIRYMNKGRMRPSA